MVPIAQRPGHLSRSRTLCGCRQRAWDRPLRDRVDVRQDRFTAPKRRILQFYQDSRLEPHHQPCRV